MKIGLFIPSFFKYDAMGNDVYMMYKILSQLGYDTIIYANDFDESINANIDKVSNATTFLSDKKNIVIYHHGVYTDFYEKIVNSKCKKIFRYHNITYDYLFQGYDENAVEICYKGRRQLENSVDKFDYYLSCSLFNNNELIENYNVDIKKTFILPPFHRIEEWNHIEENFDLKIRLQQNDINILNVGRLSPNKNHKLLIESFADYFYTYNSKSKLHIVGKIGPQKYYNEILFLIEKLNLENEIILYNQGIPESDLKTLYKYSDLFLITSLHEGFCVPIVEAMYFSLPILSTNDTALKDTILKNGIVLEQKDKIHFSSGMHIILKNKEYIKKISADGYARYNYKKIKNNFIKIIEKII